MTQPQYAIDQSACTFCGGCAAVCPHLAVDIEDTRSLITDRCTGCGICALFCPVGAINRFIEC